MSCAPPAERIFTRRFKLANPRPSEEVEIDGTWDFKWRKNAVIRVAFQKPPASDPVNTAMNAVMDTVIALAGRWQTQIRKDGADSVPRPTVPLTLDFLEAQLPAPPAGWATGPQPALGVAEAVHYDVLISFATLPLKIPAGAQRPAQEVILPRSELGRYARRFEYGSPTAFLGASSSEEASTRFWTTRKWRHIVVHEFGHILGLAHPYQQYNARVSWKPDKDLRKLLPRLLGTNLTDDQLEEYIDRQLKAHLPKPAHDGPSFSDLWPDPSAELPSVMNPVFVQALVEGGVSNGRAQALDVSPDSEAWRENPEESDLSYLRSMYQPTAG